MFVAIYVSKGAFGRRGMFDNVLCHSIATYLLNPSRFLWWCEEKVHTRVLHSGSNSSPGPVSVCC